MHQTINNRWLPAVFCAFLWGCDNDSGSGDLNDSYDDVSFAELYELEGDWESGCIRMTDKQPPNVRRYGKMQLKFIQTGRHAQGRMLPFEWTGETSPTNKNVFTCLKQKQPIPIENPTAIAIQSDIVSDLPPRYQFVFRSNAVVTGFFDFSDYLYVTTFELVDDDTMKIHEISSAAFFGKDKEATKQLGAITFKRK